MKKLTGTRVQQGESFPFTVGIGYDLKKDRAKIGYLFGHSVEEVKKAIAQYQICKDNQCVHFLNPNSGDSHEKESNEKS